MTHDEGEALLTYHREIKARAEKAEAEAAAMRDDLEETLICLGKYLRDKWDLGRSLESNAGRDLLAELVAAREVVQLVKEGKCCQGHYDGFVRSDLMDEVLSKYDAAVKK